MSTSESGLSEGGTEDRCAYRKANRAGATLIWLKIPPADADFGRDSEPEPSETIYMVSELIVSADSNDLSVQLWRGASGTASCHCGRPQHQNQTSDVGLAMSALPLKADVG